MIVKLCQIFIYTHETQLSDSGWFAPFIGSTPLCHHYPLWTQSEAPQQLLFVYTMWLTTQTACIFFYDSLLSIMSRRERRRLRYSGAITLAKLPWHLKESPYYDHQKQKMERDGRRQCNTLCIVLMFIHDVHKNTFVHIIIVCGIFCGERLWTERRLKSLVISIIMSLIMKLKKY